MKPQKEKPVNINTGIDLGNLGSLAMPKRSGEIVDAELLFDVVNLKEMLEELFSTYENMVDHRGGKMALTSTEFVNYCYSILAHRILFLNGDRHDYNVIKYDVYMPNTISALAHMIGRAYIEHLGITVNPTLQEPKKKNLLVDLLDGNEMLRLSRKLQSMKENLGISMAKALPKGTEGDPSLYNFDTSNSVVLGNTINAHPNVAFAAALISVKLPSSWFIPKVVFIESSAMRTLIHTNLSHEGLK